MVFRTFIALAFGIGPIASAGTNPVTIQVNEPIIVAGVPPVTLGPGSYVLRTVNRSGGASVVQVLNKRQDYVYTTLLAIPAIRPYPDDKRQILVSETSSGALPALHYWFPPGESVGQEFISPPAFPNPERGAAPKQLLLRTGRGQDRTAPSEGSPAD